jgi:hypothetical protein
MAMNHPTAPTAPLAPWQGFVNRPTAPLDSAIFRAFRAGAVADPTPHGDRPNHHPLPARQH